jgi:hypothetical protein
VPKAPAARLDTLSLTAGALPITERADRPASALLAVVRANLGDAPRIALLARGPAPLNRRRSLSQFLASWATINLATENYLVSVLCGHLRLQFERYNVARMCIMLYH